jgi:hypothetical protein
MQIPSPQRRIIFYLWLVCRYHDFSYLKNENVAGKNLLTKNMFRFSQKFYLQHVSLESELKLI